MEQELAALQPHTLASLAGRHGITEERARQLVVESRSSSQREIEEALELARRVLGHYRDF